MPSWLHVNARVSIVRENVVAVPDHFPPLSDHERVRNQLFLCREHTPD